MSKTLITSRDKKGLHAVGLFEAAYNKANLDENRAQQLNERGGEMQEGIARLIHELTRPNQYISEEWSTNYAYPPEYKGPKSIQGQIMAIAKIFDLDPTSALEYTENLPELPDGAEGWFAIPSVEALAAKHFPAVTDSKERYLSAAQLIWVKIASSRSSLDHLGLDFPFYLHFQAHPRTEEMLERITQTQKGDILILAAQLGMRHRGRSVRRAREVYTAEEFGLGIVICGSIILTHPERLVRWGQLDLDISGDMFASYNGARFVNTTSFHIMDGKLMFSDYKDHCVSYHSGSASGFLPFLSQ